VKKIKIDPKYVDVNITRTIIIFAVLMCYCFYLSLDNFISGSDTIGYLALFCSIMTIVALSLLSICKFGRKPYLVLKHIAIVIQCIVFWFTFAEFLYTGGTGGTSIFLIFASAPIGFFFFNLFYGSLFSSVLFIGMVIYMNTPLHLLGYQFPEMYYKRLPIMYLVEVIVCAIAQYETDRAKIKQDMALEEARLASEAKTDFLANTSHEIRTPINAVLGMNEMILRESTGAGKLPNDDPVALKKAFEKITNYAGNVSSAGTNLLAIINDILDFTKIEEGKMDIIDVNYKLSSVLIDVSNMIDFKAKAKSLMYATDVDENLPEDLWGDEVRVRQIITNLLTNAVKYTDEGSVILKVRKDGSYQDPEDDRTIRLVISVTDTGRGIREQDMDRLFDKFERFDMEKNSTIEGTGLGLAITRRLLDMMGGDISVESEYGRGSVFTVSFPQRVVSDELIGDYKEKYKQHQAEKVKSKEKFRAPDAEILIVDDTKMNLVVAREFLKDTQIKIDTARNGIEGVEKASRSKYDVILMDQRMPQMDGVEALRIIKGEKGPNDDTPVICLTADAVIGAKERYLSLGFTDYLTKPIDSVALERMLKKYLPADKVQIIVKKTREDTDPVFDRETELRYKDLIETGVDVKKGISNGGGDESFYRSLLAEYLYSSSEKKEQMDIFIGKQDLKNYGILAHGLKSTSATIGADSLSSLAAALERAAKADDTIYIYDHHEETMAEYEKILNVLKQTVTEQDRVNDDIVEEDGVLEFAPKNSEGDKA